MSLLHATEPQALSLRCCTACKVLNRGPMILLISCPIFLSESFLKQRQVKMTDNDEQEVKPNLLRACAGKALYILFVTVPILTYCAFWFFWFFLFLSPGFVGLTYWYWTADRIEVQYKDGPAFWMDIYGVQDRPGDNETDTDSVTSERVQDTTEDIESGLDTEEPKDTLKPVVICVAGGGWMFGDKMWGGLLSRTLTPAGVILVVPQYRNYPTTSIPGMVDDLQDAIQWTLDNCRK